MLETVLLMLVRMFQIELPNGIDPLFEQVLQHLYVRLITLGIFQ